MNVLSDIPRPLTVADGLSFQAVGRKDLGTVWPLIIEGRIHSLPYPEAVIRNYFCKQTGEPTDLQARCLETAITEGYMEMAWMGGKAVGTVCTSDEEDGNKWLSCLNVSQEVEGRGIGGQLVARVLEANRGRAVGLQVEESNERAIRLYERAGFEIVDTQEGVVMGNKHIKALEMWHPGVS